MNNDFYLVANWKMNFTPAEARELYTTFLNLSRREQFAKTKSSIHVWVAAPTICLPALWTVRSKQVRYGAQNVHHDKSGAFTGEHSVDMLKSCGAEFTLLGHSERRHTFKEDDELISLRTEGALSQKLPVILCVGETLEQREANKTEDTLSDQLKKITPILKEHTTPLLFAYEPVWAIGTGKVASPKEISAAHNHIKECITKAGADEPIVLYGGSVKPDNIAEIAALPEVDGALVGGASLDISSFEGLHSTVLGILP